MFSPLILATLLLLLLNGHLIEAGGGSDEFDSQCKNSHQLVTPTTADQPSSSPIVTGLQSCGSSLDASASATFSVLVQTVEGIVNSTSLTLDQQVSQVSLEISMFFELNVQISQQLRFCSINGPTGAPFGCLADVIQVGMQIDALTVDAQIQLDASGSCPLFVALQSACDQLGDPATTSAIQQLISSIMGVLQLGGYTLDQQLALISLEFEAFFQANPSLVSFVMNVEIASFGSVGNLVGVCSEFHQIATVSVQLTGSSVTDCPILIALNNAAHNTSYDITVQVALNNLVSAIQSNFSSTIDVNARLSCVSSQIFSLLQLEPWLTQIVFSIELPGFGCVYDLLACSHFCTELNICPLVPLGLNPATSSSASTGALSTSESSTGSSGSSDSSLSSDSSTTPLPTTTATPTINCTQQALNSLVVVPAPGANCILLQSIIDGMGNWTMPLQLQFRSTLKKVKKALKVKKPEKDNEKKQKKRSKKAVKHLNKYSKNEKGLAARQLMVNIPIMNGTTFLGTLGEFCVCVKPNFKLG